MKGQKKRRRTGFKKGNSCNNKSAKLEPAVKTVKTIVRVDTKTHKELSRRKPTSALGKPSDALGNESNGPVQLNDYLALRPRVERSYLQQYMARHESSEDYIIVHRQKAAAFWNKVVLEHKDQHPRCQGVVENDTQHSRKVGTVWAIAAKCNRCGYLSTPTKLYDEVQTGKPGRKAAAPNVWLQVALSKNSIGNTAARDIFTTMNVNPPSRSGLLQNSK